MQLLQSFGYAFQGIWRCINYERNMRIHMVAAAYVLVFSLFFPLSAAQYGVLFVLIGLVMALELLNTALEAAGNAISTEYHPQIKILKNTAAGAVLVLAIAAAAVACVFFWNGEGFCRMAAFFIGQPLWFLPLGFGTALSIFFIVRSPAQVAAYFRKKHKI